MSAREAPVIAAVELSAWRQRLGSAFVRLLLLAVLLFGMLAVILLLTLEIEYRAEADDILEEASQSAQKLAARTTEVLDRVGQTSLLVKHLRETGSAVTLQSLRAGGVLAHEASELLLVSDARGRVLESSADQLPPSVAETAFFKRLRSLPVGELDLGPVEVQPLLGGAALPLSRRISRADGAFDGGVTTLVPPALLIASRPGGEPLGTAYSVVGLDGVLRARMFDGQVTFGGRLDTEGMLERAALMRRTGLPTPSRIDGTSRFFAAVAVERYPLLALVAINADVALQGYQRTRRRLLLWAAGIALVLLGGTAALMVQARRLDASRQRQREAAQALAEKHGFLQSLLEYLPLPVYAKSARVGSEGRYLFWNPAAERTFHMDAARVVGATVAELFPPDMAARFEAQDASIIADGAMQRFSEQVYDGPEGRRYIDVVKLPVSGPDGCIDHLLVIAEDITERREHIARLKRQEEELAAAARRDSLTGLPNRRHFDERLAEALQRAERSRSTMALLFIDLDGFKTINDELGHEAGDWVLVAVAKRLKASVRVTDMVARLGGDEFTVVLEDAESLAAVLALCQRLVDALALPHAWPGAVSAALAAPSVGVAVAESGEAPASLLRRADDAMYAAKRAGKGRYAVAPERPDLPL